jgi:hypothetical protein
MDDRVEGFLKDVLALMGATPSRVSDRVSFHAAQCEQMFRDAETDPRKMDAVAAHCQTLCIERVRQEMERSHSDDRRDYLQLVLAVLEGERA